MNQKHINDRVNTSNKIIETLLFIDAYNFSAKENVDNNILEHYGLLNSAKALVCMDILSTGDTHSPSKIERQTYDLQPRGIELINDYLIGQKYMAKSEVSKKVAHHPV